MLPNISFCYHFPFLSLSLTHWGGRGGSSSLTRQETTFDAAVLLCGWKALDLWGLIDDAQYQKIGCDKEEGKKWKYVILEKYRSIITPREKVSLRTGKVVQVCRLCLLYEKVEPPHSLQSLTQSTPEKSSSSFVTHCDVFTSQSWLWMIKWLSLCKVFAVQFWLTLFQTTVQCFGIP